MCSSSGVCLHTPFLDAPVSREVVIHPHTPPFPPPPGCPPQINQLVSVEEPEMCKYFVVLGLTSVCNIPGFRSVMKVAGFVCEQLALVEQSRSLLCLPHHNACCPRGNVPCFPLPTHPRVSMAIVNHQMRTRSVYFTFPGKQSRHV